MTHVETVCFGGGDWSFGVYHLSSSLEDKNLLLLRVSEEGWWAGWDSVLREERVSLYSFSPFFSLGNVKTCAHYHLLYLLHLSLSFLFHLIKHIIFTPLFLILYPAL